MRALAQAQDVGTAGYGGLAATIRKLPMGRVRMIGSGRAGVDLAATGRRDTAGCGEDYGALRGNPP